jgi:hypothetical protein
VALCGAWTGEERQEKGPTRPPWVVDRSAAHARSCLHSSFIQDTLTAQPTAVIYFFLVRKHCYIQLVRHVASQTATAVCLEFTLSHATASAILVLLISSTAHRTKRLTME